MIIDQIEAVGIDGNGSLWVKPTATKFPYIYREAMEVSCDPDRRCLFSPKPREWSYLDWFRQIKNAAREQGVDLQLAPATCWHNIDAVLRHEIVAAYGNSQ